MLDTPYKTNIKAVVQENVLSANLHPPMLDDMKESASWLRAITINLFSSNRRGN